MENIVLTIHLILALGLIGVVLLQRSEGGGLGIGGGGGGGVMSGRSAATAMAKLTWILAIGFLITSLTLTVIAANNAGGGSVLDLPGSNAGAPVEDVPVVDPNAILIPDLGDLATPSNDTAGTAAPAVSPDAPATPPASE
ncbi:MAG TPA: preprotein translocase subunit SecG [Rhodobacteraceae bacterium]|nr:preprotein translocase subunit SecG [Paracoccaceae bacterium]